MNTEAFCRQSRVLIAIGKGGVGKTTVSAALAKVAARAGLSVLIVALDDAGALHRHFASAAVVGAEPVILQPPPHEIRGQILYADDALNEYLAERKLGGIAGRLADESVLKVIATTSPGLRELLLFSKIVQLEESRIADLIILDAPATGHALTFLSTPSGMADAARGGAIRDEADQIVMFLGDAARCQALLITIPEETPINETIETGFALEDSASIALAPVVVNGCYPLLAHLDDDPSQTSASDSSVLTGDDSARLVAASAFRRAREVTQHEQRNRLSTELPLAQLCLPYLFADELSATASDTLSRELQLAIEQL